MSRSAVPSSLFDDESTLSRWDKNIRHEESAKQKPAMSSLGDRDDFLLFESTRTPRGQRATRERRSRQERGAPSQSRRRQAEERALRDFQAMLAQAIELAEHLRA